MGQQLASLRTAARPRQVGHLNLYSLPPGYRDRPDPHPFGDPPGAVEWQPDVYTYAEQLAIELGSNTVIDIGCGMARKLLPMSARYVIIGIDHPTMIERLADHPGMWIGADLDDPTPVVVPAAHILGAVVICSDVIEHMRTPGILCGYLRDLLTRGASAVVLSTPDRERTHGAQHLGPPPNPAHAREWTAGELVRYLTSEQLPVASQTWTRSHTGTDAQATTLVILR